MRKRILISIIFGIVIFIILSNGKYISTSNKAIIGLISSTVLAFMPTIFQEYRQENRIRHSEEKEEVDNIKEELKELRHETLLLVKEVRENNRGDVAEMRQELIGLREDLFELKIQYEKHSTLDCHPPMVQKVKDIEKNITSLEIWFKINYRISDTLDSIKTKLHESDMRHED